MMADAWLQDRLDYSSVAEMVSKIRSKANDLKEGLCLPVSDEKETTLKVPTVSTVRHFREELLLLDPCHSVLLKLRSRILSIT